MKTRTFVWCLILLFLPARSWPISLSGRFTTAAYSFAREVPDSVRQGHLRLFQTGTLILRNIGSPNLSFQSSLRTSFDLVHRAANDPAIRVQNLFLRWSGDRLTLTGGRQFVSAGAGVGTVDGLMGTVRFGDAVTVEAYAGTLAPLGRSSVLSWWDSGHMAGVHLISSRLAGVTLGASFYRRTRRVRPYWSRVGAAYPDTLWVDREMLAGGFEVTPNSLEQQMAGFDARRTFGPVDLSSRLDVTAAGPIRVRRGDVSIRYTTRALTLSADYLYRTPWTAANTVFSIFTQRPSHEVIGRGDGRLNRHLGIFGEVSRQSFEGRRGTRTSAGLEILNGYVTYERRRGYGGILDGIGIDIRHRVSGTAWLSGGLRFDAFSYEAGVSPRSTALSATFGVHLRPVKYVSLSLEGQNLSQDLKATAPGDPFSGYRRDLRLFFRASLWFFHGDSGKGPLE